MRKIKILLSLALVFAMILSTCVVSMAASVSHVSYNETTVEEVTTVESSVFVAGQDKDVRLYTAVYDADGNFVKATTSVAAKTGLLKTSVVKEDGQVVKSFVWDADYEPAYKEAEEAELTDADIDNIEITLNGNPLSDYVDEDIAFGGTYEIDIKDSSFYALPVVRVNTKESTLFATVTSDEEALTQTITVYKGSNNGYNMDWSGTKTQNVLDESNNVVKDENGNNVTEKVPYDYPFYRYNRSSATITLKYVKSYVSDSDFVAAERAALDSWAYYTAVTRSKRSEKTFTLGSDETFKQVNVKLNTFTAQEAIIIVKPASTATKAAQEIICAADGSALTWTDDTGVITGYNYTTGYEGFNAANITSYGKMTTTQPVTFAGTDAVEVYYPTRSAYRTSENKHSTYETGSRMVSNAGSRKPSEHARQILKWGNNTDLEGYSYIVSANKSYTNGIVTFYIADDADVVVLTAGSTVTFCEGKEDGTYVAGKDTLNTNFQICHALGMGANDVAWLIKKGYITAADIRTRTNEYQNEGKITLADGSTIYPYNYHMRRMDVADVLPTNGYTLANPEVALSKKLAYEDILALWENRDFDTSKTPLVTDFNHATSFSGTGYFRYPEGGDVKTELKDYTFNVAASTTRKNVLHQPGTWPPKSFYASRTGEDNANGTGAIVSYSDALGLDTAYYITPDVGYQNDSRFGMTGKETDFSECDVYKQYPGAFLYSFKVNRDAEVMVISNSNQINFVPETDRDGWNHTNPGYDKNNISYALSIGNILSSNDVFNYGNIFTKVYPAGSTITMITPGTSAIWGTFIKEYTGNARTYSADLEAITIDGVALSGFDAKVEEYTYELSVEQVSKNTCPVINAVAEDSNCSIFVKKPFEFPGSTEITVVNPNGVQKTYTINYTYSGAIFDNLVTSPSVNFGGAKPMICKNLQVGDYNYSDRTGTLTLTSVSEDYVGQDWIRGCVGWSTDGTSNDYRQKWPGTDIIPDWISFDIHRKAEVHIVTSVGDTTAKGKYLVNNGWSYTYSSTPYIKGHATYQVKYTKTFDVDSTTGKATIQTPNLGGYSINIFVFPANWE